MPESQVLTSHDPLPDTADADGESGGTLVVGFAADETAPSAWSGRSWSPDRRWGHSWSGHDWSRRLESGHSWS